MAEGGSYTVYASETEYMDQQVLLDTLEKDPVLWQGDSLLAASRASLNASNTGKMARTLGRLNAGQGDSLLLENSFVPANLIEQNQQAVVAVLGRALAEERGTELGIADSLLLESVAVQCPLEGGRGVYLARAALEWRRPGRVWPMGCTGTVARGSAAQSASTSQEEAQGSHEMGLRPNPARGNVVLWLDGAASVEVFDQYGHVVLETTAAAGDNALDLRGFSSGLYLVRCRFGDGAVLARRLVLE
jgi:hypothetical protein